MSKNLPAKTNNFKLFEDKEIRSVWNEEEEEWYFSVVDVVRALTDSADAKQYVKKMRGRDAELDSRWGIICTPTEMIASDGKRYKTQAAKTDGILRIIQSIPSPKAEPFKLWLAEVGKERIDQMVDPEKSIKQALKDYKRLGYSDSWIDQRLKSIEIRKDLTNEWDAHGVKKGKEYATLTDIIYSTWAGKTAKEYKQYKGLHKENLRDNMTNEELVLNMLAELSTTSISRAKNPQNFKENSDCAKEGSEIAKNARKSLEKATGRDVVTPLSFKEFNQKKLEDSAK